MWPFKLVLVACARVCTCNVLEFTAAFPPQTRIVVGAKCSKTSDDSPQNLAGIPGPRARLSGVSHPREHGPLLSA